METQEKSIIEHLGRYIRQSVTLKLLAIFILMMLLMIPISIIIDLINDREEMRRLAITGVSEKWGHPQHVYGPILTLPFNKQVIEDGKIRVVREEAHILPSQLNIDGNIEPRSLHRGIYEVVVYDSRTFFNGSFTEMTKYMAELPEGEVLWNEAFLSVSISDLRGIKEKVVVTWNGKEIPVEPGTRVPELVNTGITVNHIFPEAPDGNSINFSFNLHLQGSQYLRFIPLGKETRVMLASDWKNPSFSGSFLPDMRTVNKDGFKATWKILELNRNYPQFWIGNQNAASLGNSAFGVDLMLPVNDYQKALRSAKYALLAISLTFLTFFLVEIFNKNKVHPFQYILVGLALVLFYTLLISISEHTSFDAAYIIASVAVILMTGLYARTILRNLKQTLILVLVLCLTYSFVYIILQIQDYALLIGSIGLTVILAVTMYITRNINWYELSSLKKNSSVTD